VSSGELHPVKFQAGTFSLPRYRACSPRFARDEVWERPSNFQFESLKGVGTVRLPILIPPEKAPEMITAVRVAIF
jgi:hypothetical protein